MRNRESNTIFRNIKVQYDEIAQSFARISLEVGKLLHEESESESEADDKFNSTNSATKTDTESVICQQIAVATKINEKIKSIKGSYKDKNKTRDVELVKKSKEQELVPIMKDKN